MSPSLSCRSDQPHNSSVVYFNNEQSGCLSEQSQTSNAVDYIAGTAVWTLHDYLGACVVSAATKALWMA